MAPYCLLVLIPVNIMDAPRGTGDVRHASSINNFNRLSMSNIQDYDPRMWLHALGMYLLTAFAMYFLVVEYRRARADSNQILPPCVFFSPAKEFIPWYDSIRVHTVR